MDQKSQGTPPLSPGNMNPERQITGDDVERDQLEKPLASLFKPWPEPKWMTCPACKEGFSRLNPSGVCVGCEEAKERKESEARAVSERFIAILRPGSESKYDILKYRTSPGNQKAIQAAVYFDRRKDNLFLYGPPGSGKTFLARIIAAQEIRAGASVIVKRSREILGEMHGISEYEIKPIIDRLVRSQILVMDDLGVSDKSDFSIEQMCRILDGRSDDERGGLVITSNYGLSDLASKYGDDRVTSRINGMCRQIEVRPQENGKDIDWRNKR